MGGQGVPPSPHPQGGQPPSRARPSPAIIPSPLPLVEPPPTGALVPAAAIPSGPRLHVVSVLLRSGSPAVSWRGAGPASWLSVLLTHVNRRVRQAAGSSHPPRVPNPPQRPGEVGGHGRDCHQGSGIAARKQEGWACAGDTRCHPNTTTTLGTPECSITAAASVPKCHTAACRQVAAPYL